MRLVILFARLKNLFNVGIGSLDTLRIKDVAYGDLDSVIFLTTRSYVLSPTDSCIFNKIQDEKEPFKFSGWLGAIFGEKT